MGALLRYTLRLAMERGSDGSGTSSPAKSTKVRIWDFFSNEPGRGPLGDQLRSPSSPAEATNLFQRRQRELHPLHHQLPLAALGFSSSPSESEPEAETEGSVGGEEWRIRA
ncbi:hypothetical protein AAC387_Pa01g1734 [Persea americana]